MNTVTILGSLLLFCVLQLSCANPFLSEIIKIDTNITEFDPRLSFEAKVFIGYSATLKQDPITMVLNMSQHRRDVLEDDVNRIIAYKRRFPDLYNRVNMVEKNISASSLKRGLIIPITIFSPKNYNGKNPIIVYIHGGGYTYASRQTYESACVHLANLTGAVIVSIEYRLVSQYRN
jgi:acetyl esterase